MECFAWIFIGLLAGALASVIVPGRQPRGIIAVTLVGILGGFVGGWVFREIFHLYPFGFFGSCLVSLVGAVIILFFLRALRE